MKKLTKPLVIAFATLLLITCVAREGFRDEAPASESVYIYRIVNDNWNDATVTFMCDGVRVKREAAIVTSTSVVGRLPRNNCENPSFYVTFLGSRESFSARVTGWGSGALLSIVIANALNLSSHTLKSS